MTDQQNHDAEVLVVGSINLDLSLQVERFPVAGETVLGRDVLRGGGGKGANQAVAAARLGRRVSMIGRVGDDDAAALLARLLAEEGIDLGGVTPTEQCASGLAVIEVDDSGENRIVVISGANAKVTVEDLDRMASIIAVAPVLLTQLEIPPEVVDHLSRMPRQGRLVLNPAPALASVDLAAVDIVVPNRGELATLIGGTEAQSIDEVVDQAALVPDGPQAVVVTLGTDGALVIDRDGAGFGKVEHVPAIAVEAVDTTAAGDAFCGGLADALCLGADVVEAARWAARVAAATVTRRGAQSSLPIRSDVIS